MEDVMTYGGTTLNKFDPKSMGATVLINGAFLGLILSIGAGTVLIPEPPRGPLTANTLDLTPPKPIEKPKTKEPDELINPLINPGTPEVERSTRTAATPDTNAAAVPDPLVDTGTGSALPAAEPEVDLPPPPADPIPDLPKAKPVFKPAVNDPRYAGAFLPPYPRGLQTEGVEGAATVRVKIGTDGRVKEVISLSFTEEDFWLATQKQALNKWRFKPATEDGVPVESWREITVRFRIDQE
jgi:periplasmic protein TonB